MPAEDQSPPKAQAPTGVSPASSGPEVAKGMESIRSSLQKTGSALGAGATVVLTALGLSQAYELFPLPANLTSDQRNALLAVAVIGAAAALGGAALLAFRFLYAQRRILLDSTGLKDRSKDEKKEVTRVYDEHAREHLGRDLLAIELRALRLERIARRQPTAANGLPNPMQAEADYLNSVVDIALVRAAAVVLERRARNAFRVWWTGLALAVTLVGLGALFAVGDYAAGQRDLVELRKNCSEAKAGANACETVVPKSDSDAAKTEANKAAKDSLKTARRMINKYAPRGSSSARAAAAAELVAACKTVAIDKSSGLSGTDLTAAVALCVAAAEAAAPKR